MDRRYQLGTVLRVICKTRLCCYSYIDEGTNEPMREVVKHFKFRTYYTLCFYRVNWDRTMKKEGKQV